MTTFHGSEPSHRLYAALTTSVSARVTSRKQQCKRKLSYPRTSGASQIHRPTYGVNLYAKDKKDGVPQRFNPSRKVIDDPYPTISAMITVTYTSLDTAVGTTPKS